MTLSLEEAVKALGIDNTLEGAKHALRSYAQHIVEKAKPDEKVGIKTYDEGTEDEYIVCKECGGYDECDCSGFNQAIATYHSRLLEEISK